MADEHSIGFLLKEDDSGRTFALLSTILVIGLAFHAYMFFVVKEDDISDKYAIPSFSIVFNESAVQGSDSILIGNEDTEVYTFSRELAGMESSNMMAKITFSITYEETSGQIADPCDQVLVNIPPNGFVADWQNTGNDLSDSSDDCEPMTLTVFVYPGYNGEMITEEGQTDDYWRAMWTNETYGSGVLSLEISVDTNQPPTSVLPGASDENEEVNIEWDATFFDVIIES